jgi:hypothetical protein
VVIGNLDRSDILILAEMIFGLCSDEAFYRRRGKT